MKRTRNVFALCMVIPLAFILVDVAPAQVDRAWDQSSLGGPREVYLDKAAYTKGGSKIVASGSSGVLVWDVETGKVRSTLKKGYRQWAVSPDARTAAAAYRQDVELYDLATGELQKSIRIDERLYAEALCWSPDGSTLAVEKRYNTIVLIDVKTGKILREQQVHDRDLALFRFSPDGKLLVTCGAENDHPGVVKLWKTSSLEVQASSRWHTREILSVAFSHDGKQLATGSIDGTIRFWSIPSLQDEEVLEGAPFGSLAFSPDNKTLATGGRAIAYGNRLELWDIASQQRLTNLWAGHSIKSVVFSPDGKRLLTTSYLDDILTWDVAAALHKREPSSSRKLLSYERGPARFQRLEFSIDGDQLAMIAGHNHHQEFALWDMKTNKLVQHIARGTFGYFPKSKTAAKCKWDEPGIFEFNPITEKTKQRLLPTSPPNYRVTIQANEHVTAVLLGQTYTFLNAEHEQVLKFKYRDGNETTFAISPDGSRAVICTGFENDQMVDLRRKKWQGGLPTVATTAIFSSDGKYLFGIASRPGLWRLDVKTLQVSVPIIRYRRADGNTYYETRAIAVHPSKPILATAETPPAGQTDHSIKVWNYETGALLTTLVDPQVPTRYDGYGFHGVVFNPSGNMVYAVVDTKLKNSNGPTQLRLVSWDVSNEVAAIPNFDITQAELK